MKYFTLLSLGASLLSTTKAFNFLNSSTPAYTPTTSLEISSSISSILPSSTIVPTINYDRSKSKINSFRTYTNFII